MYENPLLVYMTLNVQPMASPYGILYTLSTRTTITFSRLAIKHNPLSTQGRGYEISRHKLSFNKRIFTTTKSGKKKPIHPIQSPISLITHSSFISRD